MLLKGVYVMDTKSKKDIFKSIKGKNIENSRKVK